jgi:hypothetical protein
MFKWNKKGLIFKASGQYDWMHCYTSPLTGYFIDKNIYRIFFSTREKPDIKGNYISRIAYIDIDIRDPKKILKISDQPVIKLGKTGSFDENGTMVAEIISFHGKTYLYYMGWMRGINVPYYIQLGLAISSDLRKTFHRNADGPVIGLSKSVPYGIGNVSIFIDDHDFWHMWYTHFTGWSSNETIMNPQYCIRYACSNDGIRWDFKDPDCLIPSYEGENLATPCVIKIDDVCHMWFSARKDFEQNGKKGNYRIGYAYSYDMLHWTRDDEKGGLTPSGDEWENQMVCYPHLIRYKDDLFMIYCGNEYGKEGFGYAVLEK